MINNVRRVLNFSIKNRSYSKIIGSYDSLMKNTLAPNIDASMDMYAKFCLPEKLQGADKNVWVEYIQLVNKYKPINLGQGFPDYFPPEHVVKALEEVTKSKEALLHQYTRSSGHLRLVNVLAKLYSPLVNHQIDPLNEILIGVGATEILFCIALGLLQPGDEAIIIEPFFDVYYPIIKMSGAKPICIPLRVKAGTDGARTQDWILDPDELSGLFNERTKMMIVNTPHNPVGKVYSREELTMIGELCKKWNAVCVSDEVYEWMIYEPNEHVRIASLPGMWERTITIGSAGKTYSITGWKIGWAYGPDQLLRNLRVVHQNNVYTCSTVLQEAIAMAFEKDVAMFGSPDSYFEKIRNDLLPKKDFMLKILRESGMKPVEPQGGYFIVADWTPLRDKIDLSEETDPEDDYKFTKWMTKKVGVLAIPPSSFYSMTNKKLGENYARFCFIKRDEILMQASERLAKWKSSLRQ